MMGALLTVYAFVLVGMLLAAAILVGAKLVRPRVAYARKMSTYECGIPSTGSTEVRLNIRFYVFALLFVIFDVEALYILPWAVVARELGALAIVEMGIFLAILFLGLAFAWRKGALVWE